MDCLYNSLDLRGSKKFQLHLKPVTASIHAEEKLRPTIYILDAKSAMFFLKMLHT